MPDKPHRGFENENSYRFGEKIYTIKKIENGVKLVEWRKKIFSEDTTDLLERMKRGEELSKEILETGLEGFSYEQALNEFHPTELESAAGELFTFLYLLRPERERNLLSEQLKQANQAPTS